MKATKHTWMSNAAAKKLTGIAAVCLTCGEKRIVGERGSKACPMKLTTRIAGEGETR